LIAAAFVRAVTFQSTVLVSPPRVTTSFSIGNSPSIMCTLTDLPSSPIIPNPEAAEKKHLNGLTFSCGPNQSVFSTAE
jgi:hypothetical protein